MPNKITRLPTSGKIARLPEIKVWSAMRTMCVAIAPRMWINGQELSSRACLLQDNAQHLCEFQFCLLVKKAVEG